MPDLRRNMAAEPAARMNGTGRHGTDQELTSVISVSRPRVDSYKRN